MCVYDMEDDKPAHQVVVNRLWLPYGQFHGMVPTTVNNKLGIWDCIHGGTAADAKFGCLYQLPLKHVPDRGPFNCGDENQSYARTCLGLVPNFSGACPGGVSACSLITTEAGKFTCSPDSTWAFDNTAVSDFLKKSCGVFYDNTTKPTGFTCGTVARDDDIKSCSGFLTNELGPGCDIVCEAYPSICDSAKKDFCETKEYQPLPDCACLRYDTSPFTSKALLSIERGKPLTYQEFQADFHAHVSPAHVPAAFTSVTWPACTASDHALVTTGLVNQWPIGYAQCINKLTDQTIVDSSVQYNLINGCYVPEKESGASNACPDGKCDQDTLDRFIKRGKPFPAPPHKSARNGAQRALGGLGASAAWNLGGVSTLSVRPRRARGAAALNCAAASVALASAAVILVIVLACCCKKSRARRGYFVRRTS